MRQFHFAAEARVAARGSSSQTRHVRSQDRPHGGGRRGRREPTACTVYKVELGSIGSFILTVYGGNPACLYRIIPTL